MNKINKGWLLKFGDKIIPASVPGDITIDAFKAGLVTDPYFAENYKESAWIGRTDFTYEVEIVITEQMLCKDVIDIIFKGIDLFSKIYINGHFLGETKNMFLRYVFDIKPFVKIGKNVLEVKMESTLNKMDQFDTKDYYSIFNKQRIFLRKAQCHFGWDWAPKICGYGIWDDVYIFAHSKYQIENAKVVARSNGGLSFFLRLNYNLKELKKPDGSIAVPAEENKGDFVRILVSSNPFGNRYISEDIKVDGVNIFGNFIFKKPELWWPIGYGEQPLYNYIIELHRGGEVVDTKTGRFGFRDVALKEEPVNDKTLGFTFYVNNVPIFIKGSNWVPIECFTGTIKDKKYKNIINLAKEANINTLRVWGGGIYEKDIFYDLCDEKGILVWQDICLACADIPEEEPEFISNILEEVKYQVERLRNHPSLIHWCGGNEKTGSYGLSITHGDFFVNNLLHGFILNLDDTRSYRKQSPFSRTDIGNDKTSGESHHNVFEMSLTEGIDSYRKRLNDTIVPFVSECAIMGPSSLETLKKIFPKEHLWPINKMWKDRFMENPYGLIQIDFPNRELKYAEDLYGKVSTLEDFVKKGMMVHSECLRAELEFERAHKGISSGFLNWMYSDIWPSGTWAVVDYYLEPKEAYYQMKRSFQSIYASFYEDEDGDTRVFIVNDSLKEIVTDLIVFEKDFNGSIISKEVFDNVKVDNNNAISFKLSHKVNNKNYLVVKYLNKKTIYSPNMYKMKKFNSDFDFETKLINKNLLELHISANSFIKSLFIHFPDNYKYLYSDNYLVLEKDDDAVVYIRSEKEINDEEMILESYKG